MNKPWGEYLQLLGPHNMGNELRGTSSTIYCTDVLNDGTFLPDKGRHQGMTTSEFWNKLREGVSYVSFAY